VAASSTSGENIIQQNILHTAQEGFAPPLEQQQQSVATAPHFARRAPSGPPSGGGSAAASLPSDAMRATGTRAASLSADEHVVVEADAPSPPPQLPLETATALSRRELSTPPRAHNQSGSSSPPHAHESASAAAAAIVSLTPVATAAPVPAASRIRESAMTAAGGDLVKQNIIHTTEQRPEVDELTAALERVRLLMQGLRRSATSARAADYGAARRRVRWHILRTLLALTAAIWARRAGAWGPMRRTPPTLRLPAVRAPALTDVCAVPVLRRSVALSFLLPSFFARVFLLAEVNVTFQLDL
jgi:hypothetical protein